jgi:FMN phosphatase YigB (HAD superfamily)
VQAVFFDLGETLGRPVLSAPPVHLVGFEVFDFTVSVLTDLGIEAGLCLGVISHTGDDAGPVVDEILARAGIRDFFEPALRIYSRDVGLRKDTPEIFLLAAGRAGAAPGECVFVGESPAERQVATAAGLLVAAHPLDAREVIEGAGHED